MKHASHASFITKEDRNSLQSYYNDIDETTAKTDETWTADFDRELINTHLNNESESISIPFKCSPKVIKTDETGIYGANYNGMKNSWQETFWKHIWWFLRQGLDNTS